MQPHVFKTTGVGALCYANTDLRIVQAKSPKPRHFQIPRSVRVRRCVWVVGLHGEVTDEYVYGVAQLDITTTSCSVSLVEIICS